MAMRQSTIDRLEDYDDLAAQGYTINQAAERLGMSRAALDKLLSRRRDEQPDTFDPEAIARRVAEREQAAPKPKPTGPMSRIEGSCITGTGQATHVPLPRRNGVHHDPFAVLEAARERNRIRSPFGEHARPSRYATDPDEQDLGRFVAPDLDVEPNIEKEEVPAVLVTPPDEMQETSLRDVDVPTELAGDLDRADDAPTAPQAAQSAVHAPCTNGACGLLLTGGGAPRGWVLMRIIGSGPARKYCSASCARAALVELPGPPLREPRNANRVTPPTPAPPPARRTQRKTHSTVDVAEIARRYAQGQTPPEIGAALGHTAGTVRRALDKAGVPRRDDRAGRTVTPKQYDPDLVARVRQLYVADGLTQDQVAEQLGTSTKVVQNIMARNQIPARPAANTAGHGFAHDGAIALKQRMADAGVTSAQVRAWAHQTGHPVNDRGLVNSATVDAYLAAHPAALHQTTDRKGATA